MTQQEGITSGPNLSQYFANDPPSLFDEIGKRSDDVTDNLGPGTSLSLNNSGVMEIQNSDFLKLSTNQHSQNLQCPVPDNVRELWESPLSEPGIPPLLTMPGVLTASDLADPISDAVSNFLGETEAAKRRILMVDDVTQDERGLRQLIEAGSFRSAVNLTGRLLTIYGQGYGRAGQPAKHSPHSLQLWFTRFALLVKLGQYDLCQAEIEPFGVLNRPDVFYDFYPEMYNGKKGSMASFSFRLLLAEFPVYLNLPKLSIDRLTDMASIVSQIIKFYENLPNKNTEAILFWEERDTRIMHSIVNCALFMKDYSLCNYLLTKLSTKPNVSKENMRSLYSVWGRIYLQCGDVFGAEKKFTEARKMNETSSDIDLRDLVDKGLIAVAQNDFQEAFGFFQKALTIDSSNTMILNNMGVCLLYSGKLKDAISMYENAIKLNPKKGLNENLLINLSTLYELESSNARVKKLELLKQINLHVTDLNINLDFCLKLQNVN